MVGEVSYLVKKQCTFVGNLEFPRTVCPSIGKCTFDMSKQFAFEKSFRDGPHIDWDQCLLFPVGKVPVPDWFQPMYSPCGQHKWNIRYYPAGWKNCQAHSYNGEPINPLRL